MDEKRAFIGSVHQVNLLDNRFRRRMVGRHLDIFRILQHSSGKIPDLLGVGGRKQHGPAVCWNEIEDLGNFLTESQVQHPVRLVKNQKLYSGKIQMPLAGKIQQAARRGHKNIDAAPQPIDLRIDANPAVNHGASHGDPPCIGLDALSHLKRQFPRGGQDKGAGVSSVAVLPAQDFNQGECKGICFSRSGLGAGKNILPVENNGNGLGLNEGGGGVTPVLNGFKQFGPKAKLIK